MVLDEVIESETSKWAYVSTMTTKIVVPGHNTTTRTTKNAVIEQLNNRIWGAQSERLAIDHPHTSSILHL